MYKKVYVNQQYQENYVIAVPGDLFDVYRFGKLFAAGISNLMVATDMCA